MGRQYVALDLETTGLNRETDSIIEIGAVRFDDSGSVLGSFSTLVNPRRPVPPPIQTLTGITDADLADQPGLEIVAGDFEEFLGDAVLVGHNIIDFDAVFLDAAAIHHSGILYDTQHLARIIVPAFGEYGLAALTECFSVPLPEHHRALGDAEAARLVFLELLQRARELPVPVLGRIAEWLTPTAYPFRTFFADVWGESHESGSDARVRPRPPSPAPPSLNPARPASTVPTARPREILSQAAERTDLWEEFEDRGEQQAMLDAVAEVLNDGQSLIVEAGTGTGKSLAYLIPAACYALANDTRVVVSTSTINLQEQLTGKDIPALKSLLPREMGDLRSCQLKGRRNYLCLKRFASLEGGGGGMPDEEAYLASRILVWLQQTETGDRAELTLSPDEERLFARLSADGIECTMANSAYLADGSCFLQRARRQAEGSHIVAINHSLLLSDAAAGGHVLPPFEHLIIDEAHHLEDEASRQFGFTCSDADMTALLDGCAALSRQPLASEGASTRLAGLGRGLTEATRAVGPRLHEFTSRLTAFLREQGRGGDQEQRLPIDRSMRVQPAWSEIEIGWENLKLALTELTSRLGAVGEELVDAARTDPALDLPAADSLRLCEEAEEHIVGLSAAIEQFDQERVVWIETGRGDGSLTVTWVPLSVDGILRTSVYEQRRSVILTGATLRSGGSFDYITRRLGLADAKTLAVGSPFDYQQAALVLVPRDMPEPNHPDYTQHLASTVSELVEASQGRALVLFTAHSMLRGVRRLIQEPLHHKGITALAQGVDGSPRQLVRQLKESAGIVVLGTASFWEGVDVPGDALSLLIIARLPFAVPTDPVVAARSALYDDPFDEYTLPQAVLRFKQGFGRLIRTRTDRGALAVLDQRIASRDYGSVFLGSLPRCQIRNVPVRDMPELVGEWLSTNPLLARSSPA